MITIISEKLPRIIKNKARLEKLLNVKITNKGTEVTINGIQEDEYIAKLVIDALNFGFGFSHAISIKEEDNLFEIVNIKDHTVKKNLESVRGRVIGTHGGTISTLSQLTKCYFELKDNQVGIIGDEEHIKNGVESVIQIIRGAKQSNVYKGLEKSQPKMIYDLGLRDKNK